MNRGHMRTSMMMLTVAALLCGAATVEAQIQATVEGGGATVRYADSLSVTAATLTPSLRFDAGAFRGGATGVLSSLGDGTRTMQGSLALSALSPALGLARMEVAGDVGGTTHQDGARTGRYLGRGRLHVGGGPFGIWAGGAAGRTWDGLSWHEVVEGDFGAWARMGSTSLLGTVTPSSIGDSIRYTDTQALINWSGSRVELQVSGGIRSGDEFVLASQNTWGSASATLWLFPQLGLVAGGGTYPTDFTQGFPGARYVSVGLRLAAQPRHALRRTTSALSPQRPGDSPPRGIEVIERADGKRTIRIYAPRATRVAVMGDFTAWRSVSLSPAIGGWWVLDRAVAQGTYQLNVRIDEGGWGVPPGLPVSVDEYGTRVGLLHLR